MSRAKHEIVGTNLGKLNVVCFSHKNKYNISYYYCVCECGTEKLIRVDILNKGKIYSCGCEKPKTKQRELLEKGLKECSKCSRVKKLKCFSYCQASSDGLYWSCKSCRIMYELMCQTCSRKFDTHIKGRKNCYKCYPERLDYTYEDYLRAAKKCQSPTEFSLKHPNIAASCKRHGCLDSVSVEAEFELPPTEITKEECVVAAQNYQFRSEFRDSKDAKYYRKCRREGWLDEVCRNMPKYSGGFNRTTFITDCQRNNGGLGILYLIECWDDEEVFYKIGITSKKTAYERYYVTARLSYDYYIIWEIKGNSTDIYNLEWDYKREICAKNYSYTPLSWEASHSTECFKCHGNCKILNLFS